MATQIFESKHSVLLSSQAQAESTPVPFQQEARGGAFRGLFYAMLFNVALVALAFGLWELWRAIR